MIKIKDNPINIIRIYVTNLNQYNLKRKKKKKMQITNV